MLIVQAATPIEGDSALKSVTAVRQTMYLFSAYRFLQEIRVKVNAVSNIE
jgi:hypothetical protein